MTNTSAKTIIDPQTNCKSEIFTMSLSFVEMSIITQALSRYAREAYSLTDNIHHANAAEELYYEVNDLFCSDLNNDTIVINHF